MIPNARQVHLNALEFVFYATVKFGFKISRSKFDVDRSTNMIPPPKLKAFAEFRTPSSCAESVSRLGVLAYYARYIPIMKLVAHPIQVMAQSGVFAWSELHKQSWSCLKMLACLGFEMNVIDSTRPIYYACDSSQISCAFIAYQISTEGEILLISMDCRILKLADRHKPAAFRELLALMFCLMSNEHET